jgi:hypothetical protein
MKKLLIVLLFFAKSVAAQTTISYFPWQSWAGVTTKISSRFALDYKVETNSFFNNLNMEFGVRVLKERIYNNEMDGHTTLIKKLNLCTGIGLAFNPLNYLAKVNTINGYYIDLGIRWHVPKYEFLFINFECSPLVNASFTNGNLRTRLGLGYKFGRKPGN